MQQALPGCCGVLLIHHLGSFDQFIREYKTADFVHRTVIWTDKTTMAQRHSEAQSKGQQIFDALKSDPKRYGKAIKGLSRSNGKPGHEGNLITTYIWYPNKSYITEVSRERNIPIPRWHT